jgi:hypothetical protein
MNLGPDFDALLATVGTVPSRAKLRRHSALVVEVFLRGWSMNTIAAQLERERVFVEDAIRWEMQRREKKRRPR